MYGKRIMNKTYKSKALMRRSKNWLISTESSRQVRGAENIIPNTSLSFTPNGREQDNQKRTFLNAKGIPLTREWSIPLP